MPKMFRVSLNVHDLQVFGEKPQFFRKVVELLLKVRPWLLVKFLNYHNECCPHCSASMVMAEM